ncbi:DUF2335 domain-containing protein [Allisonella histaminiformans]|uniref:DUF2335 domain-containing protein n=1 Tax=Allisonella histaminiformans TaxID=209880 RepID=UPI0029424EAE|nr:DUF2335 domain-containing protein [Allisonella histaminiformans]
MEEKAEINTIHQDCTKAKEEDLKSAIIGNHEPGVVVATQITSGPLPAPDILRGYDDVCPGAAKIILEDFQKNSETVRNMKIKALDAQIAKDKRGQWMAWGILAFILIVILVSLCFGNTTLVGVSGVAFIGLAAQSFLKKDNSGNKEQHSK